MFWDQFNNLDGQGSIFDVEFESLDELVNVVDDWRGLNKRIHACDEDFLSISNRRRELFHGLKQMHGEGRTVLSTRKADNPRYVSSVPVKLLQVHHGTYFRRQTILLFNA